MKIITHESGRQLRLSFWFFGWWGRGRFPDACLPGMRWVRIRPRWYWALDAARNWFIWTWLTGNAKTAVELARIGATDRVSV